MAEKPMSQAGLLCGMATKPKGFADPTPSELEAFRQETEHKKNAFIDEDTGGPLIRKQDADYNDLNSDEEIEQKDDKNSDQVSQEELEDIIPANIGDTIDFRSPLMLDQTIDAAKYMSAECYPDDSISNVGGNVLTSWGTGMQGGLKICY